MKKTIYITFIILMLLAAGPRSIAQSKIPADFCIESAEMQLFEKINELRSNYEKESLQLSASLSFVAKTHVNDLILNHPDTSICNLSSWSDKGLWTPCCYNSYVPNPECMWDKPKELTNFTYRGYELVLYFDDKPVADSVIGLFNETKEALDMVLTQGEYKGKKWVSCGVGINEHFVSIWFAQRKDPASPPGLCNLNDTVEVIRPQQKTTNSGFYIIFGSYSTQEEAKTALRELKKDSFNEAGIFSKNGKSRVYIQRFNSLKEAMLAKDQLPAKYSEAWILKE
ncbi:MAG: SPOR domain-containing protein [Bacteroidales bacterium]|nr:SPOR domain-containing protein [Bacteroidales bacterium]